MFIQVIQGKVADAEGLRTCLDRWLTDLQPGATGWLGSTGGVTDDGMFGPSDYSYKLSPEVFSGVLRRIFTDITTRFHTPYGVCIHPSNWVKFSRLQGRELLRQGREFGLPIWSFDQWSEFWTPATPGVSAG